MELNEITIEKYCALPRIYPISFLSVSYDEAWDHIQILAVYLQAHHLTNLA